MGFVGVFDGVHGGGGFRCWGLGWRVESLTNIRLHEFACHMS